MSVRQPRVGNTAHVGGCERGSSPLVLARVILALVTTPSAAPSLARRPSPRDGESMDALADKLLAAQCRFPNSSSARCGARRPPARRPLRQHQIWANSRLCCAHSHTRTHLRHPAAARLRCASVVPGLSPGAIPWAAGQISREVNTSEIRVNAYATSPGRRRESPRTVVGRACVTRNARTARMTRAESALCLSL